MRTGQITGVVDRPDFTQERLMSLAMTG
jgi:hypothetical protein